MKCWSGWRRMRAAARGNTRTVPLYNCTPRANLLGTRSRVFVAKACGVSSSRTYLKAINNRRCC